MAFLFALLLLNSKKCITFAPESPTSGFRGWEMSPLGKPTRLTKHPSRGFQDIFKRRLLTLCSDVQKCRSFNHVQDLATVDVLRDIDYPSCAYWCWYVFCVYTYTHTRTLTMWHGECLYSAWASRCRSNMVGNATASERGTTTVGLHAFFVCL